MQINVSTRALASLAGTVLLSYAGWLTLSHLEHRDRLTRLEHKHTVDTRQDVELRDLRATVMDAVLMIRQSQEPGMAWLTSEGPTLEDAPPSPPAPDEDDAYMAAQVSLENMLIERGLEPAPKPELDKKR